MQLTIAKGALVPSNDESRQEMAKALKAAGLGVAIGTTFDVAIVHPRNASFNGKIFAALGELAKMIDSEIDPLRWQIMYDGGWGQDIVLPDGEIVAVLPSMSKTSMSEKELQEFWEAARDYVSKEIMIRLTPEQQERCRQMFELGADNQPNPLQAG